MPAAQGQGHVGTAVSGAVVLVEVCWRVGDMAMGLPDGSPSDRWANDGALSTARDPGATADPDPLASHERLAGVRVETLSPQAGGAQPVERGSSPDLRIVFWIGVKTDTDQRTLAIYRGRLAEPADAAHTDDVARFEIDIDEFDSVSIDVSNGRPIFGLTRLSLPGGREALWTRSILPSLLGLRGGGYGSASHEIDEAALRRLREANP